MKILDNKNKVVFSGEHYPDAVTLYWEELEKDVMEDLVPDFLKTYWEGSSYRETSLKKFIGVFSFLSDATADDTILYIDGEWYLVPFDMLDSDENKAWEFWQKMLSKVNPGYTLTK